MALNQMVMHMGHIGQNRHAHQHIMAQRHMYSSRFSVLIYPLPRICIADFRFQIVLQNPSWKLEIYCAFIRSTMNCICNIDLLWSKFAVTVLHSLSLILFKWWCVWQAQSIYNSYFIQHSFSLHHPPPCGLTHCRSHHYPVASQARCAQVFRLCSYSELTDPYFQEKMWSISVHLCQCI